ncbi:MAG: hypothetical protein ABR981_05245 [Candidatus Micrarchaeaceae archaeon]|jgi:hypothetical protein
MENKNRISPITDEAESLSRSNLGMGTKGSNPFVVYYVRITNILRGAANKYLRG